MRVLVQRVKSASVKVDDQLINEINKGYLLYVGFTHNDDLEVIEKMVNKINNIRLFPDSEDKINIAIKDLDYEILAISQFTLYGDTKRGNRPSFTESASYDKGNELYELFISKLNELVPTKSGVYGANMAIESINDGPINIIINI